MPLWQRFEKAQRYTRRKANLDNFGHQGMKCVFCSETIQVGIEYLAIGGDRRAHPLCVRRAKERAELNSQYPGIVKP